jgi:hypothetical protein
LKGWIFKSNSIEVLYTERDIQIIFGTKVDTAALCKIKKYLEKSRGLNFKIIDIEEILL